MFVQCVVRYLFMAISICLTNHVHGYGRPQAASNSTAVAGAMSRDSDLVGFGRVTKFEAGKAA